MTKGNRVWIAFANEKLCNHIKAFADLGYCDWYCSNAKPEIGDIVYILICNLPDKLKQIRYKTVVEKTNNPRTDFPYWHVPVSKDKLTAKLRLLEEHHANNLYEADLLNNGFVKFNARSIKLVDGDLLKYIENNF